MRSLPGVLPLILFPLITLAGESRVFPLGERPPDKRLRPAKELDDYFPFAVPATREAWAKRREAVRAQMEATLGLLPRPEKTPLKARIYGRMDLGDYFVEKVTFESRPGFVVTGNLYRPKGATGRVPGILNPYGHLPDGRFTDYPEAAVKKAFASGAERFTAAARSPLQARCVHLARMGCVVLTYDMIGKADCVQIPDAIAHKFAKQRPEIDGEDRWGLFSAQAEAHLQSVMGLQAWNSIRALDFLAELPDVDPTRLAVTGESGGGTQTMILAALEPDRLAAAFPAVMVSTGMQGGCTCETASGLRVDTGNVEFAGLFAPKPLGMLAADDWTKEMPAKGFPELRQLYALLGAPENVELFPHLEFPHNYNAVGRADMYAFFNRHLGLALPAERLAERDFTVLTRAQMSVWDEEHPAPADGPDFEKKLLREEAMQAQAGMHWEQGYGGPAGAGMRALMGEPSPLEALKVDWRETTVLPGGTRKLGLLTDTQTGSTLPLLQYAPAGPARGQVLWVTDTGKAGLADENGAPRPEVRKLIEAGFAVVGVDLLGQGEFISAGEKFALPASKNPREAPAYTLGYNRTLLQERVRDLWSAGQWLRSQNAGQPRLGLAAWGDCGPVSMATAAAGPRAFFTAALVQRNDRDFAATRNWRDPLFWPGRAKYAPELPFSGCFGPSPALWVVEDEKVSPNAQQRLEAVQWLIGKL